MIMDISMQRPNLYDYLKVLALVTMIVDHTGFFLFPDEIWWRVVGRIAFPLFLLLVWYNWSYKWRRSLRLPALGIQIALVVLYFYGSVDWSLLALNILLAIGLTRVFLWWFRFLVPPVQILVFICTVLVVPLTFPYIDYGTLCFSFWIAWYRLRYKPFLRSEFMFYALIGFYLGFMVISRWFPSFTWLSLGWVGLLLGIFWSLLRKKNSSLVTGSCIDDKFLWLSKNALRVYLFHGVVLFLLSLYIS